MVENSIMRYSNLQLRASLANWSEHEREKVTDARGYGSDDRRTFKYRADLLDATIARLVELEDAHAIACAREDVRRTPEQIEAGATEARSVMADGSNDSLAKYLLSAERELPCAECGQIPCVENLRD